MVCMIQYKNARLECYNQLVPYIDIAYENGYIYFPWCIESPATRFAGKVTYALKIFYVNPNSGRLVFELNTLPATGLIKNGWGNNSGAGKIDYSALTIDNTYFSLIDGIKNVVQNGILSVQWVDADPVIRDVPATEEELNIINTVKG